MDRASSYELIRLYMTEMNQVVEQISLELTLSLSAWRKLRSAPASRESSGKRWRRFIPGRPI